MPGNQIPANKKMQEPIPKICWVSLEGENEKKKKTGRTNRGKERKRNQKLGFGRAREEEW